MGTTSINSLPMESPTQTLPDYNNMYQKEPTPLIGAASPTSNSYEGMSNGPVAAK